MSLVAVAAKLRGVALHLGRADTGGFYCGVKDTGKTLFTWFPEEATCKKCLKLYREPPARELLVELDGGEE